MLSMPHVKVGSAGFAIFVKVSESMGVILSKNEVMIYIR